MDDILTEYFSALDRLKKNKPIRIPKGTKITNDSVALEAGKKKGTIKRSVSDPQTTSENVRPDTIA